MLEWEGRRLVSYEVAEDFYGDHSQYQYVTYTYNADGIRTSKNVFGVLHTYYLDGNRIVMETVSQNGVEQYRLLYLYDETGAPIGMQYRTPSMASNEFYTFWFEKNLQGDIVAVYNEYGDKLISYTYDAWGNFSSSWINLAGTNYYATLNPFRYRGYYYDSETYFYYLNSRYYNPSWGRFLNADDISYLGAGDELLGFNLFAYCGNNPVMGYDPEGTWNWGGFLVGLGVVAATIITVATFGIGTGAGAVVAAAAITTGTAMMLSAATDSTMVVDLSVSVPIGGDTYAKTGVSLVIDFSEDNGGIYGYGHGGGGIGCSTGMSYSTGFVENFNRPEDYSKHFIDVNAGSTFGIDHCFDPTRSYPSTTKATSISFGTGYNYGVGYDYYSNPFIVAKWGKK